MAASSIAYFPSTETLNLTRKRPREKQLESLSELEVVEEIERNWNPRLSLVKPSVEPGGAELYGQNTEKTLSPENHITVRNSSSLNFMEEKGPFFSMMTLLFHIEFALLMEFLIFYPPSLKVGFPLDWKMAQ